MARALSLHHLNAMDLSATELVYAAHGAGFSHVCLFTLGWPTAEFVFPVVAAGRSFNETRAALADTGVRLFSTDGPFISPDVDMTGCAAALERAASLGAGHATVVVGDPDLSRATDNFGRYHELARSFGIHASVEFMMMGTVNSIESAVKMVKAAGADIASVAVDTLHLVRTGGTVADVATLDPQLIGNVQINDGPPRMAEGEPQITEAMSGRLWPGQGSFPLREIVAALPADSILSVEAPNHEQRARYPDTQSWAKALYQSTLAAIP